MVKNGLVKFKWWCHSATVHVVVTKSILMVSSVHVMRRPYQKNTIWISLRWRFSQRAAFQLQIDLHFLFLHDRLQLCGLPGILRKAWTNKGQCFRFLNKRVVLMRWKGLQVYLSIHPQRLVNVEEIVLESPRSQTSPCLTKKQSQR